MRDKKKLNSRRTLKVKFVRDKSLDNVQWTLSPEKEKAINAGIERLKSIDFMKVVREAEAASEE